MSKKFIYPQLKQARTELRAKTVLYKPTIFWEQVSAIITSELDELGIERFRSLPNRLGYFLSNYGMITNGFSPEQTDGLNLWLRENHPQAIKPQLAYQQFLNGCMAALKNAVGVETPILGDDYLAMPPRYGLLERSVHPYGYRAVDGFHSELLLLRRK